jgi:RimJ/RimL family protein N-acetyltransferase
VLDRLAFPDFPVLRGHRVILRAPRESDIDDRLTHPVDPEEEDGYGSSWRREWDGRLLPDRKKLIAAQWLPHPEWGVYPWSVEHAGRCIGSARLDVDADQHRARYSVGLFVAALRGQGLGRETTRLVLDWAFGPLGAHRVELEVLVTNRRAIRCYEACGFRHEGVRRDAELYPDGWKDFHHMGILRAEYLALPDHQRR